MSAGDRETARSKLLAAAGRLLVAHGVRSLSVDRLVKEAGVSKGAFFHYFSTQSEMVKTVLTDLGEQFERRVQTRTESGESFVDALISESLVEARDNGAFLGALVQAVALDPELAREVLSVTSRWQHRMKAEGLSAAQATCVSLALDGLMLQCLMASQTKVPLKLGLIGRGLRKLIQHAAIA